MLGDKELQVLVKAITADGDRLRSIARELHDLASRVHYSFNNDNTQFSTAKIEGDYLTIIAGLGAAIADDAVIIALLELAIARATGVSSDNTEDTL